MRLERSELLWRAIKEKLSLDWRVPEKLDTLEDQVKKEHARVTTLADKVDTHHHPIGDINNLPVRLAAIEARLTALEQ